MKRIDMSMSMEARSIRVTRHIIRARDQVVRGRKWLFSCDSAGRISYERVIRCGCCFSQGGHLIAAHSAVDCGKFGEQGAGKWN